MWTRLKYAENNGAIRNVKLQIFANISISTRILDLKLNCDYFSTRGIWYCTRWGNCFVLICIYIFKRSRTRKVRPLNLIYLPVCTILNLLWVMLIFVESLAKLYVSDGAILWNCENNMQQVTVDDCLNVFIKFWWFKVCCFKSFSWNF